MARSQGLGRGGGAPDIGSGSPKISRGRIVSRCFVGPGVLKLIKKFNTFGKSLTNGLYNIYGYLEHDAILQPGQGVEIKRRRDAAKNLLTKAVKRVGEDVNIVNTGQSLSKKRHQTAFGFAVNKSIQYKCGDEDEDKLDVDNSSISYNLRHTNRSVCLEAGTPDDKDFSTDMAAAIFLECMDINDASVICCKSTKADKSGNKWPTAKKQLETLAAKLVPELSEEECKLFFPAVYVLINLGPHVAYTVAETGESMILLHACLRNMQFIHGGARAHGCDHDHDVLENDVLKVLNCPHPEYTLRWMKSALYTRAMRRRNAEHLALFLADFPFGDTAVAPTIEDCEAYYDRRSNGDETEEERIAREEAAFAACSKGGKIGGKNCWAKHGAAILQTLKDIKERCKTAEEFLSAAMDESMLPVEYAIELLGLRKEECSASYAHFIDLFLGHLAVIRECLADEENVHVFEDGLLMLLVPSREHASTYGYVLKLAKELSEEEAVGEQGTWDWRLKALLREGIDLGRYEEGVNCIVARRKKEERKRKRAKLEQYCAEKEEECVATEEGTERAVLDEEPASDNGETDAEYVVGLFAGVN